jgi:hypothetical protein
VFELLVVIGIASVLTSLLLPAASLARRQARTVQCASNMRQLGLAMFNYVNDFKRFPPNVAFPAPGQFWYDEQRLARYVEGGHRAGGTFSCPNDPDALRSYGMNAWACSRLDAPILKQSPPAGRLWGGTFEPNTILLAEAWSARGGQKEGWTADAIVGAYGASPGRRFGGGGGLLSLSGGRWGPVNSELDFRRHGSGSSSRTAAVLAGAANFLYTDGRVVLKNVDALCDPVTGKSTLDSVWSPLDAQQNQE